MRRALIAIVLLLAPTLVLAQAETTGRVTGTVLDEDRNPVAGAEITLESPALQGQRTSSSDANGRYLASLLPPGVYTMTVNAPGKTPLQYTFRVGIGQTVPIDAVLKSGADLVEDVTVFAPATKLETTAGGENFNFENDIDQLPVTSRTLENVAVLAPNVSFGPTPGTLSISGAPSFDTNVLLDGAELSDPYFSSGTQVYLEESIEEVQVLTTGVNARYGRFQGGVINATTKSGGNTFDGTVRADLSKGTWNSKTPFNETQSDTLNKVYSATIGGPIWKDHIWFFAGGRTIPETATNKTTVGTSEPFTITSNEDRWQLKLTGAITPNHVIEASYLEYERTTNNQDSIRDSAGDVANLSDREDPRDFTTVEYQGVLSDRTFLSVQGAEKNASIQSGGDPSGPAPIFDLFDGFFYGNGWFNPTDPSVRDNESASAALTHVLSSEGWGDHTLEFGLQYVNSITAGDNSQSPNGFNFLLGYPIVSTTPPTDCSSGTCLFDVTPTYNDPAEFSTNCDLEANPDAINDPQCQYISYRWKALPGAGDQELQNTAFYIQDTWEIGKWRVDAGLRWEKWDGNAISSAMTLDFDEISPRLGLTYNITPDWQLQASWGKYVSRFNDNVGNEISGVSAAPRVEQVYIGPAGEDLTAAELDVLVRNDANWGRVTFFSDPLQPTIFFDPGVGAPYATDLNLGVKRALPRNQGVVTVNYTRREFEDLLDDFRGGQGYVTVVDPTGSGLSSTVDAITWANCGACTRDYEAVTLTADYRPSAKWDIGGNYVFSKTRGNYEGEGLQTPSSGSIIGDYPTTVDFASAAPYGYTDDDIRHRARLWGNYRFDFGRGGRLTLGGLFFYRSGQAWNKSASIAAGSDPANLNQFSSYTKFFDGRGNNRFDGYWSLDSTIRYDINFWRDLGMYLKFDILNLTNEDSLIQYQTSGVTTTSTGGIQAWAPSRADLATNTCEVAAGGTATIPSISCRSFGRIRNQNDFQTPRQYFVTVGLVF